MAAEPRLDAWLTVLNELDGTDLLLTDGSKPLLRIGGRLVPLEESDPLTGEEIEVIARNQIADEYGDRLHLGKEVDFSFSWRNRARIRANAFYQRNTCALSLRRIPMDIPRPEDLGLPDELTALLDSPGGLILVTGPSNSGKSTSIASMIDMINRRRPCHIVTIEDPIEYLHPNRRSVVSQREVGTDTESFVTALRSVPREDPDVVLVGELHDHESIASAITIAESGHLVITTLHTNDSAHSLDRLIDVFPAGRRSQIRVQLAGTLLAVLYQRLVATLDGGAVAAYELMLANAEVRSLIRDGRTRQLRRVVASHSGDGMQTMEAHLTALVQAGRIDYEAALAASIHPQEIQRPVQVAAGSRGT